MSVQATTWVWENTTISGSPLLVMLAIADAANREGEASCQSIATLTRMTRLSESTVHRAIKWLTENGYIESLGISPRYHTHVYRIPGMGGCQSDTPVSPRGVSSTTKGGVTGDTQPQETYPKKTLSSSRCSDPGKDEGFMAFYRLYPRHEARGDAHKAWHQMIKGTDPTCIMAGLRSQVPTLAEKKPEGFCPLPATWLRAERWNDEVTPRITTIPKDAPRQPGETVAQYDRRRGYR